MEPDIATTKLIEWCDYLDTGGMDRPIDTIPFNLMRCNNDEVSETVAILLSVAASSPTDPRAIVKSYITDCSAAGLDSDSLADAVVLTTLLSLWSEDMATPSKPAMTLRKALRMSGSGSWQVVS